jgi:hypothetical protein
MLFSAAALVAGTFPAFADVTISNAATQNISCAAGVCAPTAATAVLNVADLQGFLASGSTTIITTGSGVQAVNIRIAAKLSWSASNTLTLDAYKSVSVGKPVSVTGAGGVSVVTNDGGGNGIFSFGTGGTLTFANLSSALSINGTSYTLEPSIAALASAIAANPSGAFALADSYDASQDGTYTVSPISTVFSGSFNGLGNTISNLSISDPTENVYVGLFAETSNASLANIRLANANVTGASGAQGNSNEYIGALVGLQQGGTISNAFAEGTVSGGSYAAVGGLAGITLGTVTESVAAVTTSNGYLGVAGGLIGLASGAVTNSYATGNVSGSAFVGGLVGDNESTINHSFATGTVTGIDSDTYAGGLIGLNDGTISTSSASGTVNCEFTCAGLVGDNGSGVRIPEISRSFATGNVSADAGGAGGLVGGNFTGMVGDCYATGSTIGKGAGGLVATNEAEAGSGGVVRSYASGMVTGTEYSGGLIAYDDLAGSLKKDYWDTTTSGITNESQGAGNVANDPGIKGLSNTKLQSKLPNGFNPRVWAENPNINNGLPYLIDNPPAE